jgi:hypothetical protein
MMLSTASGRVRDMGWLLIKLKHDVFPRQSSPNADSLTVDESHPFVIAIDSNEGGGNYGNNYTLWQGSTQSTTTTSTGPLSSSASRLAGRGHYSGNWWR